GRGMMGGGRMGGMGGRMGGMGMGGMGMGGGMSMSPPGEDCLYLNVWSAANADARAPVLVLMFGGDYAANDARYSGETLALDGAVVVSFEHRVGALGFLAHPDLSKASDTGTSG